MKSKQKRKPLNAAVDRQPAKQQIVMLHNSQSMVGMNTETDQAAFEAAYFVTMSPHKWEWTTEQQVAMARYVLWAHQRLSAIAQLTGLELLARQEETKLFRMCRELDMEMDGVACPASAAACLNAIRQIVTEDD